MKVSLEFLYHFRCDRCEQWWSRADIEPEIGETVHCPYCGYVNQVEGIQTFRNAAKNASLGGSQPDSCLRQKPDPEPKY
jgi:DNA-directed RNA polymerase subunit RPC12/RpoP